MHSQQNRNYRFAALVLGVVVAAWTGFAQADPPTRVARVGYVDGQVSFSPAGEDDWVQASLNRPLVTGDRLWADGGARVELQIGTAAVRLGPLTSITLLNLDDRVAQFQLTQGTLNVRVRRQNADQVVEIDTPNLAYVLRRPGQYRISVDPDGQATQVSTASGRAEVYGEGASYVVGTGMSYRFAGTGLRDYENLARPPVDEFDRWALERDRGYDNSASARYVSRDVIGAQDLDAYGTWRSMPEYGNVWVPSRVSADWAPYRDGHWAWVDPWGWTWVDDAPWGFAVSHYGRWANIGGGWGWIPGPVAARAVYAPALVAFVGGNNFQVSISTGRVAAVGWFPLGPRDVYRPAYPVSRAYFNNVNVTNTVINTTNITNVYNNRNATNVTYVNQQVTGAVVTVPTTAFVQSQPVARAAIRVPHDEVVRAPVAALAAIAPMPVSVRGAAAQGAKPPQQVLERPVVARSAPPAAPVAFAAREHAMASNPGKPLDTSAVAALKPATPIAAPKIAVVAPTRTAAPIAAPPPRAAPANPRAKGDEKGQPKAVTQPTAPVAPPPAAPPAVVQTPPVKAPAPTPAPIEQRGRPEPRIAPPPPVVAPPAAAPPAAVQTPPVKAPAPTPAPIEQRGKPEPRVAPPPPNTAPPVAAPPAAVQTPPVKAPAPTPAPIEQRGKPEPRIAPLPPVVAPPVAAPPPPVVTPPAARPPPQLQSARPEPPAVAKPMPNAPAPVARPPDAGKAAGAPAKGEQRGKDSRSGPDKKGDEPAKDNEEPKRK